MDTVLYSASPLRAFSGLIFLTVFFFVVGLVGALIAILGRRDSALKRLGAGCSGVVLLLAGVVMVITTYRSYQTGDRTVVLQVDEKNEVVRNCDSPGGTCRDYVVEGMLDQIYYTFNVGRNTWDKMAVGDCYEFSYYPPTSLLSEYLQDPAYADTYESSATITRIEQVNCQ